LKRGTVSLDEMMAIAHVLNVRYEQAFVLSDGEKIEIESVAAMKYGGKHELHPQ